MKYAVVVKALFEEPWTETVEDNKEDADARKKFIEAHLRNVKVDIVPCGE